MLRSHLGHDIVLRLKLETKFGVLESRIRFGALEISNNEVLKFNEKPRGDGARIDGGFFVLSPKVIEYISDDKTIWEREPLNSLATDGQLMSYFHDGFWHAMDTLRDQQYLEDLWQKKEAPWKVW